MSLAQSESNCSSPSLRSRLRAETAQLHTHVDNRFRQLLLQSEEGYAHFLAVSAGAILPIENALEASNVAAVLPDWPQRRRAPALEADLAALALPIPSATPTFQVRSEASMFGILYVLEGSRLGAKAILHAMDKASSPVSRSARRYLSHGVGQPLWQTFLARLEASPEANRNGDDVMAGARAAFRMFLE